MKFKFTKNEISYLDRVLTSLSNISSYEEVENGVFRIIHKIKYKFTKTAHDVFLSQKEREFLLKLLDSRMHHLEHIKAMSEEAGVVNSIIKKVESNELR